MLRFRVSTQFIGVLYCALAVGLASSAAFGQTDTLAEAERLLRGLDPLPSTPAKIAKIEKPKPKVSLYSVETREKYNSNGDWTTWHTGGVDLYFVGRPTEPDGIREKVRTDSLTLVQARQAIRRHKEDRAEGHRQFPRAYSPPTEYRIVDQDGRVVE